MQLILFHIQLILIFILYYTLQVALQFPEEFAPDAPSVYLVLKRKVKAHLHITFSCQFKRLL